MKTLLQWFRHNNPAYCKKYCTCNAVFFTRLLWLWMSLLWMLLLCPFLQQQPDTSGQSSQSAGTQTWVPTSSTGTQTCRSATSYAKRKSEWNFLNMYLKSTPQSRYSLNKQENAHVALTMWKSVWHQSSKRWPHIFSADIHYVMMWKMWKPWLIIVMYLSHFICLYTGIQVSVQTRDAWTQYIALDVTGRSRGSLCDLSEEEEDQMDIEEAREEEKGAISSDFTPGGDSDPESSDSQSTPERPTQRLRKLYVWSISYNT